MGPLVIDELKILLGKKQQDIPKLFNKQGFVKIIYIWFI